jgi:hypothetical protein
MLTHLLNCTHKGGHCFRRIQCPVLLEERAHSLQHVFVASIYGDARLCICEQYRELQLLRAISVLLSDRYSSDGFDKVNVALVLNALILFRCFGGKRSCALSSQAALGGHSSCSLSLWHTLRELFDLCRNPSSVFLRGEILAFLGEVGREVVLQEPTDSQ